MRKRGLSSVITTVLIILLVLVTIGIIWGIVSGLLKKGVDSISTSTVTLDLSIESATLDTTSGISNVKIFRNSGEGNLVGIKFVFEDQNNGEVFEKRFTSFNELETKTFTINLNEGEGTLFILGVNKVSIAPILILDSGKEVVGKISDKYEELTNFINDTGSTPECENDNDCGGDQLIGQRFCSGNNIVQNMIHNYCNLVGNCQTTTSVSIIENCDYFCNNTNPPFCTGGEISCTQENVTSACGSNETLLSSYHCSNDLTSILGLYNGYTCPTGYCSLNSTIITIETCEEGNVCQGAVPNVQCVPYIECYDNGDCTQEGYICEESECVLETAIISNGVVENVFPPGVGEFFDSFDLPSPSEINLVGYSIFFTDGVYTGYCMTIEEHHQVSSNNPPYVRLDVEETNISSGDHFQVWQTNYGCTFI